MHVQVDLGGISGPVRLLSTLPDFPVGLLQGYNGIGKTLTVRLLEVLTGTMPYPPDEPAWVSMCRAIGPGTVTISGLHGAQEIRWTFDTSAWEAGGELVRDGWFDSITTNGKPITLAQARQSLRVHRLAGDETLLDSLAGMVDGHRSQLNRLLSELIAPEGRLTESELAIDRAAVFLDRVQPERFLVDLRNVEGGGARLKELTMSLDHAATRLQLLEQAAETTRMLQLMRLRAPELDNQITRFDADIARLEEQRTSLDTQLKTQTQRAAVSDKVRHDLENARRTRDRNRDKLSGVAARLSAALATLELGDDPGDIAAEINAQRTRIAELEKRKEAADAAPQLRTALDAMNVPLDRATERGLGDAELLELNERPITVRQLATAARRRRRHLEGLPPAPEVLEIDRSLDAERRRLARLVELPELLEEVDRFTRLRNQQEERLNALLATGALEAAKRMQQLEQQRAAADHELLRISSARAAAAQQRASVGGGVTQEQLEQDLLGQLAASDTDAEQLDSDLRTISDTVTALTLERTALERTTATARVDLDRQRAELRELLELLKDPKWRWVVSRALPEAEAATLKWLDDHQSRVARLRDRLGRLRASLLGIVQALDSISAELRGQGSRDTVYEGLLRHWLSDQFSRHFDQPLMREHLFPGATDVRVDLTARHVTWQADGRAHSRPLTALSSGEQAFAYTQARLAGLDVRDDPNLNRLIVLDEFGSFIAENRLHSLYELLLARRDRHPRDQVLIVLPLREDFATQAANAFGAQRDLLLGLADQLSKHEYAVQDLTR
jgi:hypothetical protein